MKLINSKTIKLTIIGILTISLSLPVFADTSVTSYKDIEDYMLLNNTSIQKMKIAEKNTRQGSITAKVTENRMENTLDIIKELEGYGLMHMSTYDKFKMILTRDTIESQMKYAHDSIEKNLNATKNAMKIALRGMYLGLYNTYNDLEIKKEELKTAEDKYEQAETSFNENTISQIEFDEAKFTYQKAKKEYDILVRDLENMERQFNAFVGKDIDTTYSLENVMMNNEGLKSTQEYIDSALENRSEIWDLEEQIKLKELEKEVYERRNYLLYSNVKKDYNSLMRDYEILKIKLENAKKDIEKEIRLAYMNVRSSYKQVTMLRNILNKQNQTLSDLKAQNEAGYVTDTTVEEIENAIKELRKQYHLSIYNYNTSFMKLKFASDIGPGYEEGGIR